MYICDTIYQQLKPTICENQGDFVNLVFVPEISPKVQSTTDGKAVIKEKTVSKSSPFWRGNGRFRRVLPCSSLQGLSSKVRHTGKKDCSHLPSNKKKFSCNSRIEHHQDMHISVTPCIPCRNRQFQEAGAGHSDFIIIA